MEIPAAQLFITLFETLRRLNAENQAVVLLPDLILTSCFFVPVVLNQFHI